VAIGANARHSRQRGVVSIPQAFKAWQRGRQLDGRNEPQPLTIENAEQSFEDVLTHGVGAARAERPRVELRRRAKDVDRGERAAVSGNGNDRGVEAGGAKFLGEASSGVEKRAPAVDAQGARAFAVQNFGGAE
jgi:hypothetical protein